MSERSSYDYNNEYFGEVLVITAQSSSLALKDIHQHLGCIREYGDRWDEFISLEDLTTEEITELLKIRSQFDRYLVKGKVLEGQVRLLTVNPLLRLSGFMNEPITIQVETGIAPIVLPESEIIGRMDLLSANAPVPPTPYPQPNIDRIAIESSVIL